MGAGAGVGWGRRGEAGVGVGWRWEVFMTSDSLGRGGDGMRIGMARQESPRPSRTTYACRQSRVPHATQLFSSFRIPHMIRRMQL